jgi:two-component system KDP operon response regulator KdpE
VVVAATGNEALNSALEHDPDLVILDLLLPDMSGVDVCRKLREWRPVPILVVSGRDEENTKITLLDLGADDYITKPFGLEELLARLRALLRRAPETAEPSTVDTAEFSVDLGRRMVTRNGEPVRLTPTEWSILELLVRSPGKLITQQQILATVWGPAYEKEANYLRVYIAQLRRKLEADTGNPRHLLTEAGIGYRFRP